MKSFIHLSNRPEVQNATRIQLITASATAIDYMLKRWEDAGFFPINRFDDFLIDWTNLKDYSSATNKTSMKSYEEYSDEFARYAKYPMAVEMPDYQAIVLKSQMLAVVDKFLRISFYPMKKGNAFYITFSGLLSSVVYCLQLSDGYLKIQDGTGKTSEEEFRLVQIVRGAFGV